MRKRLLSLMLAVLMTVSLLPSAAFADASDAAPDNKQNVAAVGNPQNVSAAAGYADKSPALVGGSEDGGETTFDDLDTEAGQCGDSVTWTLTANGVLTVSGSGAMWDFTEAEVGGTPASSATWAQFTDSILSVVVESGVTYIGNYTFRCCDKVTALTLPDSVAGIGSRVFSSGNSLKSLSLGAGVTEIASDAFSRCSKLESISVSASNTAYSGVNNCLIRNADKTLVLGCGNSVIPADGSVTAIGDYAFCNCVSLSRINIPKAVTSIGSYAFYGCKSLTSVNLPEKLTAISRSCFEGCSELQSVFIPVSVASVGSYAFKSCSKLNKVYYSGSSGQYNTISVESGNDALSTASVEYNYIPSGLSVGGKCGENLTWELDSNGVLTVSGTGSVGNYSYTEANGRSVSTAPWGTYNKSITSLVISEGITGIGDYAFYNCTAITSVSLPEGLASIGNYSFYGCSELSALSLPASVQTIGSYAFCICSKLAAVSTGEGVQSIGSYAFYGCSALTGFAFPSGFTSLGDYAFAECSRLSAIVFPEGTRTIGSYAFSQCAALSMVLPASIESIGAHLFSTAPASVIYWGSKENWNALTVGEGNNLLNAALIFTKGSCGEGVSYEYKADGTLQISGSGEMKNYSATAPAPWSKFRDKITAITVSDGVTGIGSYAFYGCSAVKTVNIASSVAGIGGYAFYGCGELTSADIPAGVKAVNKYTFYGCAKLASAAIPESIETIGEYAFYGCGELTALTVPAGVISVGAEAFTGCAKLGLEYKLNYSQWFAATGGKAGDGSVKELTVGGEKYLSFGSCGENAFYVLKADGTLSVDGSGAMSNFSELHPDSYTWCYDTPWYDFSEKITAAAIQTGITSIGENAFAECLNLASVTMADTVENIGSSAFRFCPALEAIEIGSGVKNIGEYAFSGCSSAASVTFGSSVGAVGAFAFADCSSVDTLYYDGTLLQWMAVSFTEWSSNPMVFAKHIMLQNEEPVGKLEIPETVSAIPDYCFLGWDKINSVSIPGSVKEIGEYAFADCASLAGANLMAGVETVGFNAFSQCYSLSSVNLAEGVKYIGDGAFNGCVMTDIVIPDGVTYLGSYAFSNCELTSVVLPASLSSIGASAFAWNTGLADVTFSSTVLAVGDSAFSGCGIKSVKYAGTKAQWNSMSIEDGNSPLTKAKRTYISEMPCIHSLVVEEGKAAACEQDGYTDCCYCTKCNRYIKEKTVIPAIGHDWSFEQVGNDPESGAPILHRTCSHCTDESTFTGAIIEISGNEKVLSAKSATYTAAFAPENITGTAIVWSVVSGSEYGSVKINGSSLTFTAKKGITEPQTVVISAAAADGLSMADEITVTVIPLTTSIQLFSGDSAVTGKTVNIDLNSGINTLQLTSASLPFGSEANVTWKSSSTKVATVDANGLVTANTTGKVTVTAAATDGSKKYAKVTVNVVRYAKSLTVTEYPETMQSGKRTTLVTDVQNDRTLTDRNVVWGVDDEFAAYCSVYKGALTAKTVYEPVTVTLTAYAKANPSARDTVNVTILPAVTSVSLTGNDAPLNVGGSIHAEVGQVLNITPITAPKQAYLYSQTYKSSNTKAAQFVGGQLTCIGDGTATVTYSISGKSASFKLIVGTPVSDIVFTSAVSELRSGKSFTFKAETNADASIKKLTYSLMSASDSKYCTIYNGKLTAKTVYEEHTVNVVAAATDGTGFTATIPVVIKPAADDILIVRSDEKVLNGTTVILRQGESLTLDVSNYLGGDEDVTWKTSSAKCVSVTADGRVDALTNGSAAITATGSNKRTASFTVKVAVPITGIAVSAAGGSAANLIGNQSVTLSAAANSDATTKKFTWELADGNDSRYCTVSAKGVVKAKSVTSPVTVYVKAVAADGSNVESEPFPVNIYPAATAVNMYFGGRVINGLSLTTSDRQFSLRTKVLYSGAREAVTWKTSSAKIATVDQEGNVTVLNPGKVTITATAADGSKKAVSATFTIK